MVAPTEGPTTAGEDLEASLGRMTERYGDSLDWVADTLGGRGVMELERLATAMWMTKKEPGSVRDRAAIIRARQVVTRSRVAPSRRHRQAKDSPPRCCSKRRDTDS